MGNRKCPIKNQIICKLIESKGKKARGKVQNPIDERPPHSKYTLETGVGPWLHPVGNFDHIDFKKQ